MNSRILDSMVLLNIFDCFALNKSFEIYLFSFQDFNPNWHWLYILFR